MYVQVRNRMGAALGALLVLSPAIACDEHVDDPLAHGFDEGHAFPGDDSGTSDDHDDTSGGITSDVDTADEDSTHGDAGDTTGEPTDTSDSFTDTSGGFGPTGDTGSASDDGAATASDTSGTSSGGGGVCGGAEVGGHCWYLGGSGVSCATTCAAHGGYSEGTNTFAGGNGTNGNCQLVLNALGVAGGVSDYDDSVGVGCYKWGSSGWRAPTPTTTAAASASGYYRVCACGQ